MKGSSCCSPYSPLNLDYTQTREGGRRERERQRERERKKEKERERDRDRERMTDRPTTDRETDKEEEEFVCKEVMGKKKSFLSLPTNLRFPMRLLK